MGDRRNIFITENGDTLASNKGIYLYTHWNGSSLTDTLKNALAKKWRWDDDAYLARIIFCEMVKGAEMDETGYGISLERQDYDNSDINVLTDSKQVEIDGVYWYFEEFINR